MADQKVQEQQNQTSQPTQEEIKKQRANVVSIWKEDIEFLKVKAEYEEVLTRIEVAQRDRMIAIREKALLLMEQKEAEKKAQEEMQKQENVSSGVESEKKTGSPEKKLKITKINE